MIGNSECTKSEYLEEEGTHFNHGTNLAYSINITNYTGSLVWCCNSYGTIFEIDTNDAILDRNLLNTIVIEQRVIRPSSYPSYSLTIQPKPKASYTVVRYTIPFIELLKHEFIYIEELDLVFAGDSRLVVKNHPKSERNLNRKLQICEQQYVNMLNNAPVRAEVNDSTGYIDEIYLSLGQTSIRVKATHYTEIPDKCNIYLGSQYGNYEVFSFDINELKMATEVLEQVQNDIVVCISLNEYKVKQWCMARKRDSDQYISMSQYKKDIQSVKDMSKTTIEELKLKNEQLKQRILHYEAKEERELKRRECDLKEDEYSLKREQMKVEIQKVVKEIKKLENEAENDVPEKLSIWAKCVKFVTDAIKAVVDVFNIFKSE